MEDLRKNYNVNKKNRFNPLTWWIKNKNILRLFGLIGIFLFIIIRPDLIGSFIGTWINSLISSFTDNSNISIIQWMVILITILIGFICYRLFQRRNKN